MQKKQTKNVEKYFIFLSGVAKKVVWVTKSGTNENYKF